MENEGAVGRGKTGGDGSETGSVTEDEGKHNDDQY